TEKITLYTSHLCPYAQRVAIALMETGIPHESVEIDLQNKPSWYDKINPELKNLLPADPIKRAEIRFAIEYFSSKVSPQFYSVLRNCTDEGKQIYLNNLTAAYKRLDELLVAQAPSGPYFLGDQYSLADIAIAPFAARLQAIEKHYLNDIAVPRSRRVKEFFEGIISRPSAVATFCGDDTLIDMLVSRWGVHDPRK
ncbi:glutathione S-transferase, partial [Dichotomocladium elegans]